MAKKIIKPKYKIGDLIVYQDRHFNPNDEFLQYYQSKIVESWCLASDIDKEDTGTWFYNTEQSVKMEEENLEEEDILYKI